jgi:hypothetical protein
MTIQFKPEQEQVIDQAIQTGLIERADQVVELGVEALRSRLEAAGVDARSADPQEWIGRFRAWAHSHQTTTPLLSDDAISRVSIYGERGL